MWQISRGKEKKRNRNRNRTRNIMRVYSHSLSQLNRISHVPISFLAQCLTSSWQHFTNGQKPTSFSQAICSCYCGQYTVHIHIYLYVCMYVNAFYFVIILLTLLSAGFYLNCWHCWPLIIYVCGISSLSSACSHFF